jgi:hypothetical protein
MAAEPCFDLTTRCRKFGAADRAGAHSGHPTKEAVMPEKKRRSVRSIQQRIHESSIAERAYERWVARGCPSSDGLEDWFAAQRELEREGAKPRASKSAQA